MNMKSFKDILLLLVFLGLSQVLWAQDAVVIGEGDFVRGEIKGTNFESVFIEIEGQGLKEYKAKDVRSFLWNGDTYESKPIILGKRPTIKFFKLLEGGTVNLYSIGSTSEVEPSVYKTPTKAKPKVGLSVGMGSGMGSGLGISIGGGQQPEQIPQRREQAKVYYFIEKPGTGPIQELAADGTKTSATKALLLNKLSGDEGLAETIKNSNYFDEKVLLALVKSYNESMKAKDSSN